MKFIDFWKCCLNFELVTVYIHTQYVYILFNKIKLFGISSADGGTLMQPS